MKQKLLLCAAALIGIAILLHAQTTDDCTSLCSKTWMWKGLSADLPLTTLFTPKTDSDFMVTAYVTNSVPGQNCIVPYLRYTDEYGAQVADWAFIGGLQTVSNASGAVLTIHVVANTPVKVGVNASEACGGLLTGTYDLVIGKIKINP
jgi:hypothetical protein